MSGAQGAQPKGAFTATTYTSAPAAVAAQEQASGQAPRMELRSGEDERGLPVKKLEDTVRDAAGQGRAGVRRRHGGRQA